jgi:hypothetical protein
MYYHVTHTDRIPKIRKEGLLPMQTSNWIEAGSKERYGGGDVFAFEDLQDAIRWAGTMDWSFNTEMGSGKISIIEVNDMDGWEVDNNDPLGQMMSNGKWMKRAKRVLPDGLGKDMVVTNEMLRSLNK